MRRGFGIDASVSTDVAGRAAPLAATLGYGSFWVNGSPPEAALDSLAAAASTPNLDLGVGVVPLTSMEVGDLIQAVIERDLPQDRLWLGIGSSRNPGGLDDVRSAVEQIRAHLDCRVVTGAVGPMMTQLAGEEADCVLFTWWPKNEVASSRQLVAEAAADAGRSTPVIASYIRCALLPQAAQAVEDKSARYAAIPRYAEVFARNDISAAESVVTGRNREELLERIVNEEVVIDLPVIRAITADDSFESIAELARACAPA
jgi:alkanesulfonate monooxygenase SsuD/methylene tetrahydromethanopterin reductase-like flavin-dependent oxidoreductase (luciferase family)